MTIEHKANDRLTPANPDMVRVKIDIPEGLYTPWPETYGPEPKYDTGGIVWPPTREWIVGEHTTESLMSKADYDRRKVAEWNARVMACLIGAEREEAE